MVFGSISRPFSDFAAHSGRDRQGAGDLHADDAFGDSLYDRAEAERQRVKADALAAPHFLAVLDDAALRPSAAASLPKDEAARQLVRGYQLFHR